MEIANTAAALANPPTGDRSRAAGPANSLGNLLAEAEEALSGVAAASASAGRLGALAKRIAAQRLHVAILGQFKRGKSTFLNAILGSDLLPTAVVPLTAVPIFIEYGQTPIVRVHYNDDRPPEDFSAERGDDLRQRLYTAAAEEANPENRLGVDHVQVFFPASALADGMVLIDTPGIGSTHRHNTETARRILPECDAGLMVLSVDPPITEAELAYLSEVRRQVPRLFYILNKIDYLNVDEREQARSFLNRVLTQHLGETLVSIHNLSARRALAARLAEDEQGVAESGLAAIERDVFQVLAVEKANILNQAITGKAKAVLATARGEVALAMAALRMPVDDLERALAEFKALLPAFDRQRRDAQDLLVGDRRRMINELEDEANRFRDKASNHLDETIAGALATADRSSAAKPPSLNRLEALARDAVAEAIPTFFEAERDQLAVMFSNRVAEVFGPHQRRAAELIGAVRRAAAELFKLSISAAGEAEAFEFVREPYWTERDYVGLDMIGSIAQAVSTSFGWVLPRAKKIERLRRRLHDDAMTLIRGNVESLRWSTLQSLKAACRKFSGDLDRQFAQAIEATQEVIQTALAKRSKESGWIADDLRYLEDTDESLAAIESRLGEFPAEQHSR
jgi:predicted GTPase